MQMQWAVLAGIVTFGIGIANTANASSLPNTPAVPTQIVVTVLPASHGGPSQTLRDGDVVVLRGSARVPVVRLQRLSGDLADMQLFVLLDDSTRTSSLGLHLPELKAFLESLPSSTQVAIGYMRNGSAALAQAFTTDHETAASALRLPTAVPGENGSPYFALSDLAKHWPSKQSTDRRAVLMLTDGVDRYYGNGIIDDPYVDDAIHDVLKNGVMVYSIYLRGAGLYGRGEYATNFAQSRLMQVSEQTGGYAYFQDFTDPVTIAPFLSNFQDRLDNQYRVTLGALSGIGVQPLKVRTEVPGVKIQAPTRVYIR
jgi:hypothetical protein